MSYGTGSIVEVPTRGGVRYRVRMQDAHGKTRSVGTYDTVEEAVTVGNDTEYGLAAYVSGGDQGEVRKIASQLRAGQVNLNGASPDLMAPFGGYKMSGNGREWGDHAFGEFLETKAILGYSAKVAAE